MLVAVAFADFAQTVNGFALFAQIHVAAATCEVIGNQNRTDGGQGGIEQAEPACTDFFPDSFRFITAAAAVDDNIKAVLRQTKRNI